MISLLLRKGRLFDVCNLLPSVNTLAIKHIYSTMVLHKYEEDYQSKIEKVKMWYNKKGLQNSLTPYSIQTQFDLNHARSQNNLLNHWSLKPM
jgi:hypothetical protein